jgi:hypothetical protein
MALRPRIWHFGLEYGTSASDMALRPRIWHFGLGYGTSALNMALRPRIWHFGLQYGTSALNMASTFQCGTSARPTDARTLERFSSSNPKTISHNCIITQPHTENNPYVEQQYSSYNSTYMSKLRLPPLQPFKQHHTDT